MQHAIETGKIQGGEAGLRSLRKALEANLGIDVDISIINKAVNSTTVLSCLSLNMVIRMRNNLYCKIFIDSSDSREQLAKFLAKVLNIEAVNNTIVSSQCEIDVRRNEDFDISKAQDDFVYFRKYLDIYPNDSADREKYLNVIKAILVSVWEKGLHAIAACDFENELPFEGGILRFKPRTA